MDELALLTEIERLKTRVKSQETQIDMLQRILAEYISNPKPPEVMVRVDSPTEIGC